MYFKCSYWSNPVCFTKHLPSHRFFFPSSNHLSSFGPLVAQNSSVPVFYVGCWIHFLTAVKKWNGPSESCRRQTSRRMFLSHKTPFRNVAVECFLKRTCLAEQVSWITQSDHAMQRLFYFSKKCTFWIVLPFISCLLSPEYDVEGSAEQAAPVLKTKFYWNNELPGESFACWFIFSKSCGVSETALSCVVRLDVQEMQNWRIFKWSLVWVCVNETNI